MRLSQDLVAQIAIGPKRITIEPEAERRHAPRFPLFSRTAIHAADRPSSVVVLLRDISESGFGFLSPVDLPAEEHFTALLPHPEGEPAVHVRCIVRRRACGGSGGTQFVIGAEFVEILDCTTAQLAQPTHLGNPADTP